MRRTVDGLFHNYKNVCWTDIYTFILCNTASGDLIVTTLPWCCPASKAFPSLSFRLPCTRTRARPHSRPLGHTHTRTHIYTRAHRGRPTHSLLLTPFSFQKALVRQIDRLEWKWGGRSVSTPVRTRPFEQTSKLGSYHHGSYLGYKGLLFVFALVK